MPDEVEVLIVDDEPLVRRTLSRVLTRDGYRVVALADAAEAIAHLQAGGAPHLVITDLNLPGQSGIELARAISTLRPSTPVLITTGAATAGLAVGAEVVGFLEKPFDMKQLTSAVEAALRR